MITKEEKGLYWWALSPDIFDGDYGFDSAFSVNVSGYLDRSDVDVNVPSFRPAVSLASSAVITDGVGTIDDPYIVG